LLLDFLSRLLTLQQSRTESIQFVVQREELIHKIVFHLALVSRCHMDKPHVIRRMIDSIRLENTLRSLHFQRKLEEGGLGVCPPLGQGPGKRFPGNVSEKNACLNMRSKQMGAPSLTVYASRNGLQLRIVLNAASQVF
jgi:hypothetical protein